MIEFRFNELVKSDMGTLILGCGGLG